MKRIIVLLLAVLLVLSFAVSCKSSPEASPSTDQSQSQVPAHPTTGTTRIKIFATSDIHGYIMDASSMNPDTFQYRMAHLSYLVNQAREEYDGVLLLNGGNNYEGTTVSNLLEGAPMRAAMDLMEYDGTAMGNHEFDWDNIKNRINADAEGTIGTYTVGSITGDSDVPVLASNLYYKETGKRVEFTKDYVIEYKNGYKVALIGWIEDFSARVMTSRIEDYEIDTDTDKLNALIDSVHETEKPDVTIIVSFSGASSLASKVDAETVDLIIGGHSGSMAGTTEDGIVYLQGSSYIAGYAEAVLVIDNETGEKSFEEGSVTTTSIVASGPGADNSKLFSTSEQLDPVIKELSDEAWSVVEEKLSVELGYVTTGINAKSKVTGDSNASVAGNWITGLMLRWAQGTEDYSDTVVAFYNNGGIRSSISIPEGETQATVTASNVYSINPFSNYWYIYEATASEIAQQIMLGFKSGDFGNEMSGITYTYTYHTETSSGGGGGKGGGSSTKTVVDSIDSITIVNPDGTTRAMDLSDETTTYKVCISNYSATLSNKNGTSVFADKTPLNEVDAPIDNETLVKQLLKEAGAGKEIEVDTTARGTGTLKSEE
ncbi:MAG: bifunctional metallophosphatase/5'-nucleotidase [Spirochaetales bacterium]|nr:bifunctional metallophosphatase/5'-nucleotidase [Spirochaetales bacterium]